AQLQERIAECVREKLVEGIAELRDESDRDGVRLVVELKRDADPDIVLNQLFRYTALQTSFGVNMLAINGGRPEQLTLRDIIAAFIAFREEVITRRTTYLLNKARERAHTLVGLLVAVANIDEIIALIRAAPDPAAARAGLVGRRWPADDIAPLLAPVEAEGRGVAADGTYQLSDEQARAILDLRLQRLTGLERDKISDELQELVAEIGGHLEILRSRQRLIEVLRDELLKIKEQFANPRRTTIEDVEFEADIEALIQREDMVVTVSHAGYIKRVPLSTYRAQRRGGRGRAGMAIRFPIGDVRVFAGRNSVGVRGIRLLEQDQVISMSILRHEEITPDVRHGYLGMARDRRRQMGEESEAAEAQIPEQPAEPDEGEGENGNGVGEAALTEEQFLDLAAREEFVLSVTQRGFGVRSPAYDYRITGRGGQGVNNMDLSRRRDAI